MLFDKLFPEKKCPTCGLRSEIRDCPQCGREACSACIAVDNTDCICCGPMGEIALEIFKPPHNEGKV